MILASFSDGCWQVWFCFFFVCEDIPMSSYTVCLGCSLRVDALHPPLLQPEAQLFNQGSSRCGIVQSNTSLLRTNLTFHSQFKTYKSQHYLTITPSGVILPTVMRALTFLSVPHTQLLKLGSMIFRGKLFKATSHVATEVISFPTGLVNICC